MSTTPYKETAYRLEEILKKTFDQPTNAAIGCAFGVSEATVRNWRTGREHINGKALAELARRGADIHWLLTGERAAPSSECQNGRVCERLPMLLRLLAEMFEETADPEKRETVIAALQGAIAATEADKQGKKGSA